jgi:GTP pyrophosphokinase
MSTPNPAWLAFVRTGRARSKIRHYLKSLAHAESEELGAKLLDQALRAEGIEGFADNDPVYDSTWAKLLRFTGSKNRHEMLTDIGLGKRIAHIVAKRLVHLLVEIGKHPDALLLTRERFAEPGNATQGSITLDGSENASVQFARCCRPIPGDLIVGYLGRGEGLVVHAQGCAIAKKLQHKDNERFIDVDWGDDPVRTFETGIVVTTKNGKGVLAKVAEALATAEADIVHIEMEHDAAQDATDLRFVVAVRDTAHLEVALRNLKKIPSVLRAVRTAEKAQD